MRRHHAQTAIFLLACLGAALLAAGCRSAPTVSTEGLSAAEIFQRAQDSAEKGDSLAAIRYYEAFKEKRPDDRERVAWASYEIAFLYHKMKKDDTALVLLDELLAQYTKEGDALPAAPRILAENLKTRLQSKAAPKTAPKTAP
jgi:outer membrane protein assembly factor BamD (BamD/ComL family)